MDIILDNAPQNYETGQSVTGVVRVNIADQWKASDVSVSLIGYTQVEWTPDKVYGMYGPVPITAGLTYTEKQGCLELTHLVTDEEIKPAGGSSRDIPFRFNIPEGIPSSYKSDEAEVDYKIVAIIKTSDDKENKIEREINILAPVVQRLNMPVTSTVEKHFDTLSLASGNIIMNVSLLRKGYYPGETIKLYCYINNYSSVDCTPRATLYQTKVLLFRDRHKASQTAHANVVVGKKVEKYTNLNDILEIPLSPEAPLTIKDPVITIKYFIHVTLDIPHAIDIHANLPFVVSTRSALDVKN